MQLSFNLYGLIIGVAVVVAAQLIQIQLKKQAIAEKTFYKIGVLVTIFAVIGARFWHVFTDFYLYSKNLLGVFEIWNGGLSIFGGILGGVVGLVIGFIFIPDLKVLSQKKQSKTFFIFLDSAIFGLPVAQAIGRLGNYVNQELYGLPTSSFPRIFIDEVYRLPGFKNIAYYHPLFFYEMVVTGLFAFWLYVVAYKSKFLENIPVINKLKIPKIGTGGLFYLYIFYYSVMRFLLDFLRVDKALVLGLQIGVNQLILLVVVFVLLLKFGLGKRSGKLC